MIGDYNPDKISSLQDYTESSLFLIGLMTQIKEGSLNANSEEWAYLKTETTKQVIHTLSFLFNLSGSEAEGCRQALYEWACQLNNKDPATGEDIKVKDNLENFAEKRLNSDEIQQIKAKLEDIYKKNG